MLVYVYEGSIFKYTAGINEFLYQAIILKPPINMLWNLLTAIALNYYYSLCIIRKAVLIYAIERALNFPGPPPRQFSNVLRSLMFAPLKVYDIPFCK